MANPDLEKKTLNLRRGDFEFLDAVYRPKGIEPSVVIRRLVSRVVDQLRPDSDNLEINGDLE